MIQITQSQWDKLTKCHTALAELCRLKRIKERIESADDFEREESKAYHNRVHTYETGKGVAWEKAFTAIEAMKDFDK